MDWDCWNRAFSATRRDPSDAKRELKEFHHRVVATRLVLVSHEASVMVGRESGRSGPDDLGVSRDGRS
jgi:hypothetical protein